MYRRVSRVLPPQTERSGREAPGTGVTHLHDHLEVADVVVLQQQVQDRRGVGVGRVDLGRDVALEAARVVLEAGALEHGAVVERQADGAEVDLHVLEGARRHAAAARAGRQVDLGEVAQAELDGALVGDELAVARHGRVAAVEDGRRGRVAGVERPVPVGLGAAVAALVDQRLLVLVREPTVPGQEGARVVDRRRLVDVRGHEIVVAGADAGDELSGRPGRELLQAPDRVRVGLPLRLAQFPPRKEARR